MLQIKVKIIEIESCESLLWKPEHAKEPFNSLYGKCQIGMFLQFFLFAADF